jgi:hypothetical protein
MFTLPLPSGLRASRRSVGLAANLTVQIMQHIIASLHFLQEVGCAYLSIAKGGARS